MPKIAVSSLKPGMKLSRPITNESGVTLLGENTELTEALIRRLENMQVENVSIQAVALPSRPPEELLAELDARFRRTRDEPLMVMLRKAFEDHIRGIKQHGPG